METVILDERTHLHFAIHSVTSANGTRSTTTNATIVAPIAASLSIGTVTSHMASVTADTADDVGSEVSLLGAIILAVSDLTTYSSWSEVILD
jgi:hypothetical protein